MTIGKFWIRRQRVIGGVVIGVFHYDNIPMWGVSIWRFAVYFGFGTDNYKTMGIYPSSEIVRNYYYNPK